MKKVAADSMTKRIVTISMDSPMAVADALLREKNIRHLPVTNESGVVIGILSLRDLHRAMNKGGGFADVTVADFTSCPAKTVRETTPLAEVAAGMLNDKISAYLVCGADEEVVGIISTDDMLELVRTLLWAEEGGEKMTLANLPYTPVMREAMQELSAAGI